MKIDSPIVPGAVIQLSWRNDVDLYTKYTKHGEFNRFTIDFSSRIVLYGGRVEDSSRDFFSVISRGYCLYHAGKQHGYKDQDVIELMSSVGLVAMFYNHQQYDIIASFETK